MDLVASIINKNIEKIQTDAKIHDINYGKSGFTPLWASINGEMKRPAFKKNDYAEYEIVNFLLEIGANPNIKCLLMTPLYSATFHGRVDIVKLLLLYGANPNEHSFIKCEPSGKQIYEVPLNVALRENNYDLTELLIKNGAIFNKVTIEKIKSGIKAMKNDCKVWSDMVEMRKLKKTLKLLEENYNEAMENSVKEYLQKNCRAAGYFSCFQKRK